MDAHSLILNSALDIIRSEYMEEKYAGFWNIVKTLVEQGSVMFPIHSSEIEEHLKQYSFITFDGAVPDAIDIIQFSFDREAFMISQEFREYVQNLVEELEAEAARKEREAFATRKEADRFKALTALSYQATMVSAEPGARKTWMAKMLDQGII